MDLVPAEQGQRPGQRRGVDAVKLVHLAFFISELKGADQYQAAAVRRGKALAGQQRIILCIGKRVQAHIPDLTPQLRIIADILIFPEEGKCLRGEQRFIQLKGKTVGCAQHGAVQIGVGLHIVIDLQ